MEHGPDHAGGRPVEAVVRAAEALEALAEGPLAVGELARRLGVHKATASRLAATLCDVGLAARDGTTGQLRLGPRLLGLAAAALARLDLRELARPLLAELAAETGETATLSVPTPEGVVTADFVASGRTVLSQAHVGRTSVAHATATGKVVLAFDEGALDRLPRPLQRFTARTVTDPEALRPELARVRAQGWAEADGEREEGLHALAVPVHDARGALAAVLGLQGPDRFDAAARAAARPALVARAGRLSALLGART